MKHFLLLLFISFSAFAQNPDSTGLVLVPIPSYNPSAQYTDDAVERSLHYMKNYKSPLNVTPQAEMSFQEKMKTLNDDKFNFEEYNIKPSDVYDELPSGELKPKVTKDIPEKDTIDDTSRKIAILIVGLIAVFVTFITFLFSKRNKQF
ncbi:MAG: hypothetical protein DI548_02225 [Flavobacterium johnsoniae]|nr:MAG: hypothetical protein DI548_02225 [Flavobacterium johnsoniae]